MKTLHTQFRENLRLHRRLRVLACPTDSDRPLFRHCMTLARERGMSRTEALQFTVETRSYYL